MIEYQYKAKNKDGEILEGTVEAESTSSAAKVLISRELYPISVSFKDDTKFSLLSRVTRKDKVFLIRQLATAVAAGLPISQSLEAINNQTKKKKLKDMIVQVNRDIEGGTSLSKAFSRYPKVFNQIDLTLMETGETTGTLDKTLKRLADTIEGDYRIIKKIRGAMMYPVFVLVIAFVMMIAMSIWILPQMEDLYASFEGAKLPMLTRALLAISGVLRSYMVVFVIILFVTLVVIIKKLIKTEKGRNAYDSIKIGIPIINKLIKGLYLSRFSRTMASLVGAGVSIIDSLTITARAVNNSLYERVLIDASNQVKSGIALSDPLKSSELFPPIVSQMVQVGEQTGEMDSMLTNLADYYDDEVDNIVKNITSIIEPLMIVIVGGIIGIIMIGVMLPIYTLGGII